MRDPHTKGSLPSGPPPRRQETPAAGVRAGTILRERGTWLFPVAVPLLMVALITAIYVASVVDPPEYLSGLPVRVVNDDEGVDLPSGHTAFGDSIVDGLQGSEDITSRLDIQVTTLDQARADMDRGRAYATLVIPEDFTASAIGYAGAGPASAETAPFATVRLLENTRLGSLGTSLAAGVLTPAVEEASRALGEQLSARSTAEVRESPALTALLSDPIVLEEKTYRPLPERSALGLGAFYLALIAILAGFLAGTVVHSGVDGRLGYAATEVGTRLRVRVPVRIDRWQTLIVKWVIATAVSPLLAGLIVLVAGPVIGLHLSYAWLLWLMLTLGVLTIAVATLALLAAFGSLGQLIAMVVILYLSLASSGGTIPVQALPGFLRELSRIEPLRQVLDGVRGIVYFDAQWDAGPARAVVVLGIGVLGWIVFGLAVTTWYDRKGLHRIAPHLIEQAENAASPTGRRTGPPAEDS